MVLEADICAEDLWAHRVDFKIKTIWGHERVQAYSVWLRIHNGANILVKGGRCVIHIAAVSFAVYNVKVSFNYGNFSLTELLNQNVNVNVNKAMPSWKYTETNLMNVVVK